MERIWEIKSSREWEGERIGGPNWLGSWNWAMLGGCDLNGRENWGVGPTSDSNGDCEQRQQNQQPGKSHQIEVLGRRFPWRK